MVKVYRVERGFETYDEALKAPRKYKRGEILKPKEAVQIKSLGVLMSAGNVVEIPEELAREIQRSDKIRDHTKLDLVMSPLGNIKTEMPVPEVT